MISKGDFVKVTNNEIFGYMGFAEVTGEVILVTERAIHIRCEQTGCMELVQKNDGDIEVIS